MRARATVLGACAVVAMSGTATAQTFPADSEYVALECGDEVMTDLFQDEAGALAERDIVGDTGAPAGLITFDDEFLYLRIRVDEDPTQNGRLRPFSWGMEFDVDGDLATYEILILADGVADTVSVFENTTTTIANDPNDPADQPAVAEYAFSTNGEGTVAAGSSFGGNADHFLSMAAAWDDLMPLGLSPDTGIAVWVASSSTSNSLNADFACHNGSTGEPTLSGVASDPTTVDPGGNPPPPPPSGDSLLEGGGGCAVRDRPPLWMAVVVLLWLVRRKAARW